MTAHGNNIPWSPERVEKLTKLWAAGKSGTEIAEILGGDATRASVIGKANRLKLAGRDTPANLARRASYSPGIRKPAAPPVKRDAYAGNGHNARGGKPSPIKVAGNRLYHMPDSKPVNDTWEQPGPSAILLIDRRRLQCAWPVGEPDRPAAQLCCGGAVMDGGNPSIAAYCPRHQNAATSRAFTRGKPDAKVYERAMRRFA